MLNSSFTKGAVLDHKNSRKKEQLEHACDSCGSKPFSYIFEASLDAAAGGTSFSPPGHGIDNHGHKPWIQWSPERKNMKEPHYTSNSWSLTAIFSYSEIFRVVLKSKPSPFAPWMPRSNSGSPDFKPRHLAWSLFGCCRRRDLFLTAWQWHW